MVTEAKKQQFYRKILSKYDVLYAPIDKMKLTNENSANSLVLAPIINLFVMWLLEKASQKKIKRLFFLARDGYPMYLIAKKYCDSWKMNIECKYLYCSRYSLRVPLYEEDKEETLEHVCRGGIDVSLHKILRRSGLSECEIYEVYNQMETEYALNEIIPYAKLGEIKIILRKNLHYWKLVNRHAQSALKNISTYFRQEGLLDDFPMAIVDSGWTGTTQKALNKILCILGNKREIQGFYFGLFEIPDGYDMDNYNAFYFMPKTHMLRKVFFNNCFLETVLCANHGTTMGYAFSNGKMEPVLGEAVKKNSRKTMDLLKVFLEYTNLLLFEMDENYLEKCSLQEMTKCLSISLAALMWNPCNEEAVYFGNLFFSDDVLDDNIQNLAAKLNQNQLFDNHLLSRILHLCKVKKKNIKESAWCCPLN